MKPIRIGTRGSQLALWQANETSRRLLAAGFQSEIVVIRTTGDRRQDVPLATIGGKGLFIKELEEALEAGEVDIAVHSLKDVPSLIPSQFALVSYLERADPRDVWIQLDGRSVTDLPPGARVGTSSPRRRAQLLALRPDLDVQPIRGNVDTRIGKLHAGDYDGMVLAAAGLSRLERQSDITSYFPVDVMVPAAGQGIVGIEIMRDRDDLAEPLAAIDDDRASAAARAERGVLESFGTILDCYSSIAVHATVDGRNISLSAFVSDANATKSIRHQAEGAVVDGESVIRAFSAHLVEAGALELLAVEPATPQA
jgi:hydroxymethylbilane synthase